ncbi:UPF0182 family protein [Desulfatitalea alkaliphila]|uniref:UPF0182 protein MRX98_10745 n=1 Tax=Desulfatitalea alkaliphila TaxID=2929485 RepID=A0AA41R4Z8_9BACT|nr:UPF0182 family protein [Desulfatitalea alkaliphila]MCJ8501050.1 UPF0182 family protein [Desulfatitalea alkaliphila]
MQKDRSPNRTARRLIVGLGLIVAFLAFLLAVSIIGAKELVNYWWFDALGYQFFYLQRMFYQYIVFGGALLLFFLIFLVNFWVAARCLKSCKAPEGAAEPKDPGKVIKAFQSGSLLFYVPLSFLLSIPLTLPLYRNWEQFLFYIFGPDMGVKDPFFGKDVSYYLFSYPIHAMMQQPLLIALAALLVGIFLLYAVKSRMHSGKLLRLGQGAKWHLTLLTAALVVVVLWSLYLQSYALLYSTMHEPLFYGPGYVQLNVVIPIKYGAMAALAATSVVLLFYLHTRRGKKVLFLVGGLLAVALLAKFTPFLPQLVDNYMVRPNEIEKERPYIERHIAATLDAYDLKNVETRQFRHEQMPGRAAGGQVRDVLRNIPVWDAETLTDVFLQLQVLRPYYTFPLVSVGRHTVQGDYQQVFVAPREIDYDNLPAGAQNWINRHLSYTHGHGVVMTPASQGSGSAMTWYIHNIPPESRFGMNIAQPRIYFGLGNTPYAIAPNQAGEMDYPQGESNALHDYDGRGGVPISSFFRRFLFAYHFDNKNIFFSTKINKQSKILFRRNVEERVHRIAPFLTLDQTPYVTVTSEGVYWVMDAFTTSPWYPAAAPFDNDGLHLNYIRNSIKIVVDAYHGDVDFYLFDERDPIARAYSRIYPGLLKDKASMPAELQNQMRYPKDLFDIQMQIYAKYHQTDPRVFYQQEDLWTFAQTMVGDTAVPLKPYYLTLDLIETGKLDFMLLQPMFPKGRDNLRSMAVVGCDPANYGKVIVYDFPKGELAHGPAQIDALINQDPDISQQFSLWSQAGSSVVRGKMIIMPVEDSILFIQPVYLKSTARVTIPELQRIIMSEGQAVVMERSLEEAYNALRQRLTE